MDLATFRFTSFKDVAFIDCNLTRADFTNADLRGGAFTGCDLTGAQFAQADCAGTRFTRCELAGIGSVTSLRGATSARTTWPCWRTPWLARWDRHRRRLIAVPARAVVGAACAAGPTR